MRMLIAEDDVTSCMLLEELLKGYGSVTAVGDGVKAVEMVEKSLESSEPFDLICLDIMMPEMDGQEALKRIRDLEEKRGILSSDGSKILMITALDDVKNLSRAFKGLCDGYLAKPINREKLMAELRNLGLINKTGC